MVPIKIKLPLTGTVVESLRVGQMALLSGCLLTARDAAHKRLTDALIKKEELPVDLRDQVVYYVGPSPAAPGRVIGAAGPTTSGRMDPYTPLLLAQGLKAVIGKGYRSADVVTALIRHKAIYFITYGGTGALLCKTIKAVRILAYADLGAEAIHEFIVEDFPVIVGNDIYGGDIYGKVKIR